MFQLDAAELPAARKHTEPEAAGNANNCDTPEVALHFQKNRQDITEFEISTRELQWTTLDLTSTSKINILASYDTDLIRVLGLSGKIKNAAENGAKEEWVCTRMETGKHDSHQTIL
jgi:hypothetical protein